MPTHRTPQRPANAGARSKRTVASKNAALWTCLIATCAVAVLWWGTHRTGFHPLSSSPGSTTQPIQPGSLNELLRLSSSELSHCDIALLNLLCAQDLPGADALNSQDCLAVLDQWAAHVRSETDRNFHRFRDNPAQFDFSEPYYRMLMMAVVVYEDFGVRYNPDRISAPSPVAANDHFFADSRDIFLHGLCGGRRMGTCSSLPVLYAALGRRLGYPLKLVTTKAHLFLRWEGPSGHLNLETTGRGMNHYDDAHYMQWPFPVTQEDIQRDGFLKSLTPPEELALFLSLRGHCLKEAGHVAEAEAAYAQALRLAPQARAYQVLLASLRGDSPFLPPARFPLPPPARIPGPVSPVPDPNPLLKLHQSYESPVN